MTGNLKRRFIVFTMVAITCLLLFQVLAINVLNWTMLERQTDMELQIIVDADATFQKMNFNRPPQYFRSMDLDRMTSSRFFMVVTDPDGEAVDTLINQISSIDSEKAIEYAQKALGMGKTSGRIGLFKFAVKEMGPNKLVFFIDVTEQGESFKMVLFGSSMIALLCWVILLVIVILLSGRVVRPVLEGIEKQKQFITNAGHEMKTPLAIIQSNNETMALIHGENKYNVHIKNQTKRLNTLMTNLLTLAKLGENIKLSTQMTDISAIATEMLVPYQEAAKTRELTFKASIETGIEIQTNEEYFRQLLAIILDNAIKYTVPSGFIDLSLSKDSKHVCLVSQNSCPPEHEKDAETLFERFYRGDNARTQTEKTSGYGIGLSAARSICEALGGRISAQYTSDTTIKFEIKI